MFCLSLVQGCEACWLVFFWQTPSNQAACAGYSLWTNRSFKLPLLAGATACILGNCLYSMGYDARALWLLLVSRLVVGLG